MQRSIRRETTGHGDYNDIDNIPLDIQYTYTTITSRRTNDTLVPQEATDVFKRDTSSTTNIPIITAKINNPTLEWTKYVSNILFRRISLFKWQNKSQKATYISQNYYLIID